MSAIPPITPEQRAEDERERRGTVQTAQDDRKVVLLESLRMLAIANLIFMLGLGVLVWKVYDHVDRNDRNSGQRTVAVNTRLDQLDTQVADTQNAAHEVRAAFDAFKLDNQTYIDNHARTQRLLCYTLRLHHEPLPDNGDCDAR